MERLIKKTVLIAVMAFALAFTFAVPLEDSPTWAVDLLGSKAICILGWIYFAALNRKWRVFEREE